MKQHKVASKSELFAPSCRKVVDTKAVVDVRFLCVCEAAVSWLTSLPPFMPWNTSLSGLFQATIFLWDKQQVLECCVSSALSFNIQIFLCFYSHFVLVGYF